MDLKKSKKLKNIIEIIAMIGILAIAILIVGKYSAHQFNSHEVRVKNFFELDENTVDVINIGASEIYTGFSPEYLWGKHKITSYNLATAGAPMGIAENQIKSALKTQKPKLFVISINGTQYNDRRATAEGYVRMWVDNMPESELRQEAIDKLVKGDKSSYKYKFLKYHINILRLPEAIEMEKREKVAREEKRLLTISGIEGFVSKNREFIKREEALDMSNYIERTSLGKKTQEQLNHLLEFLKKEDINNVVFVNMPTYFADKTEKDQKRLKNRRKQNEAIAQIEAKGFKVYDFVKDIDKIGLDSYRDFYNWGHLNAIGQRKMTEYFYQNVLKDMNFKSYLSKEVAKRWDENVAYYNEFFYWAKDIIENRKPSKMKYDYAIIKHIEKGSLKDYEKFVKFKGNIIERKNRGS